MTKLYSTMFESMPSNLQAYNGILYWASTDPNDNSGSVNAYVLSQNRYFSMYSSMSVRSLNVDAFGVYFTDFAAVAMNHYDLDGGNFSVLSTVSGNWTDLVVEGGLANLALTSSYVYFTDAGGRLRRVAKDGSKPSEVVFTPCGRVETVTTVGDTAYFVQSLEDSKGNIVLRCGPCSESAPIFLTTSVALGPMGPRCRVSLGKKRKAG